MKQIFILFLICLLTQILFAQPAYDQRRDYVWIMGIKYDNPIKIDHIYLDFKPDTMTLSHQEVSSHQLRQTNASICDTAGNLLFYSNGCVVADSNFQYLNGVDTINKGVRWDFICPYSDRPFTNGYNKVNGCWILPVSEKKYKILYANEMNNMGHLSGIKFTTIIQDSLTNELSGYNVDRFLIEGDVSAYKRAVVRHANGQGWWIVNNEYAGKTMYIAYTDSSDQVFQVKTQTFNDLPTQKYQAGQACFSPDGSIYASFDTRNFCQVYDFDRCTGTLSNVRLVPPLLSDDSIGVMTGVAISPNSRYLYLMTRSIITQYDLQASDIASTAIIVAVRDNWAVVINGNSYIPSFYQSQLGPDGKIYVFNFANWETFAVIESPDSVGIACNVRQHKFFFPEWGHVLQPPRFPNFRLGPLEGSPCDSIPLVGTQAAPQRLPVARLKLSPNPTSSHTVADITVSDYRPEQHLVLRLTDITGKVLRRVNIPAYTPLQRIETSGLAKGLYFVSLEIRGRVAVVEKLVVVD
jgi:hypothetical protein